MKTGTEKAHELWDAIETYERESRNVEGDYTTEREAYDKSKRLLAAIARELDTPIRWRPIGEAPKDGSLILVAFKFDGEWAYEFAVAEAEGVTLVEFIKAVPEFFCPLVAPEPTP